MTNVYRALKLGEYLKLAPNMPSPNFCVILVKQMREQAPQSCHFLWHSEKRDFCGFCPLAATYWSFQKIKAQNLKEELKSYQTRCSTAG